MSAVEVAAIKHSDHSKSILGFWIYLMTDIMLFAGLFATYIVLEGGTNGGPSGADIFKLPFVLIETLVLLVSSYTCGLMILALHRQNKNQVIGWLVATLALGAIFLGMELTEFGELIGEGFDWQLSAFLSAFFTLVATHGLHITAGLIWISFMIWQVLKKGLTDTISKRLSLLSMFWHFLDVIWIFIFTVVYMMGVL